MERRLRALERVVGHTLFQRTADGFVLTDKGNAVLGPAERIEEEVFAFERRLAGNEAQLEGALRISSSDWFGNLHAGARPRRVCPTASEGLRRTADGPKAV
jgi:DNA-binding transcriptional LysR family regulator